MNQEKTPMVVPATKGVVFIGPYQKTDNAKCNAWRDELQSRTRGTRFAVICKTLAPADQLAFLLHVRGGR